jgi:hypothetical protein
MPYVAFSGFERLASGTLAQAYAACSAKAGALIFDTDTGRIVDIDPRFPPGNNVPRPGRPKLGVVAREDFLAHIENWPADVRDVLLEMSGEAFTD